MKTILRATNPDRKYTMRNILVTYKNPQKYPRFSTLQDTYSRNIFGPTPSNIPLIHLALTPPWNLSQPATSLRPSTSSIRLREGSQSRLLTSAFPRANEILSNLVRGLVAHTRGRRTQPPKETNPNHLDASWL